MFPLYDESHRSGRMPIVTIGLIFFNTLIFLFTLANLEFITQKFGLIPNNILQGKRLETIFTSMFLHGGFLHLIGNMWFLWIFGDNLETTIGKIRFLFLYILSGFLAGVLYCFLSYDKLTPVVGASGAISGVLGGYLLLFPRNKVRTLVPLGFFLTTVSIPAIVFLLIWLLFQFLLPEEGVATGAHIIGFFSGILLVKLFRKR